MEEKQILLGYSESAPRCLGLKKNIRKMWKGFERLAHLPVVHDELLFGRLWVHQPHHELRGRERVEQSLSFAISDAVRSPRTSREYQQRDVSSADSSVGENRERKKIMKRKRTLCPSFV